MSKVSGVVDAVKDFPTRTGATMYSLIVDGGRYGCGSRKPACKPGDTVTFDMVQKGEYKNIEMSTLVVEAGVPRQPARSSSGGGFSDNRQETISKQAALNTAISFVKMVVDAGALPGTTAKLSAEDKYGIIEGLVDRKVQEFYEFSTGSALAEGPSKQEAPAAKEPAQKEEWT